MRFAPNFEACRYRLVVVKLAVSVCFRVSNVPTEDFLAGITASKRGIIIWRPGC